MRTPGATIDGVEIFLPRTAIDELEESQRAELRAMAERFIDQLQDAIDAAKPAMTAAADEDGAREMTAAIFLLRANDLLREIRVAAGLMVQTLGLRSAFELLAVGRFFLVDADGADEFRRRLNDSLVKEGRLAPMLGATTRPPADFLAHLVEDKSKPPRDLATIARKLDRHDGLTAENDYSAQRIYALAYSHVSNSGSHASLSSIKRYTRTDGPVLFVNVKPETLFRQPPVLLLGGMMRDLASKVFETLRLSQDTLPDGLVRPR